MAKQGGAHRAPTGWQKHTHEGYKGANLHVPCCSEQVMMFAEVRSCRAAKVLPYPLVCLQECAVIQGEKDETLRTRAETLWLQVSMAMWAGLDVLPAVSLDL